MEQAHEGRGEDQDQHRHADPAPADRHSPEQEPGLVRQVAVPNRQELRGEEVGPEDGQREEQRGGVAVGRAGKLAAPQRQEREEAGAGDERAQEDVRPDDRAPKDRVGPEHEVEGPD
jgi:hypothetical protein